MRCMLFIHLENSKCWCILLIIIVVVDCLVWVRRLCVYGLCYVIEVNFRRTLCYEHQYCILSWVTFNHSLRLSRAFATNAHNPNDEIVQLTFSDGIKCMFVSPLRIGISHLNQVIVTPFYDGDSVKWESNKLINRRDVRCERNKVTLDLSIWHQFSFSFFFHFYIFRDECDIHQSVSEFNRQ